MKTFINDSHKIYTEACQKIVEETSKQPCSAEQMLNRCRRNLGLPERPMSPFELFGIEVEKGWRPLVEPILQKIEELNAAGANIRITQVKEKWGELCVYLSSYTPELEEMINEATRRSTTICENCGKPAQRVWGNYDWIFTLCPDCLKARKIKVKGPVNSMIIEKKD